MVKKARDHKAKKPKAPKVHKAKAQSTHKGEHVKVDKPKVHATAKHTKAPKASKVHKAKSQVRMHKASSLRHESIY